MSDFAVLHTLGFYLDMEDAGNHGTLSSVQVERSDNPIDFYYLCRLNSGWFVIFETDHVLDLGQTVKEVAEIFNVRPMYWVVKRDRVATCGATMPLTVQMSPTVSDALVQRSYGSPYIELVLAVEPLTGPS